MKIEKRLNRRIREAVGANKLCWIIYKGILEIEDGMLFFCPSFTESQFLKIVEMARTTEKEILSFYTGIEASLKDEITETLRKDNKYQFGFLNYDLDRLSRILNDNKSKRCELASRVLGLTFGMYVYEAARITGKKACRAKLKKYIEESYICERYKPEILKYSLLYLIYKKQDTRVVRSRFEDSNDLDELEKYEGLIAYGLLRKNINIIYKKKQPIDMLATSVLFGALRDANYNIWAKDETGARLICPLMSEECVNWINFLEEKGIIG